MPSSYDDIEQIVDSFQATPEYLAATGIRDQFFDRVTDLLTIHAIGSIVPAAIPVGALLGVFEVKQLPADPSIFQVAHVRQVVRWDRLATLFTDPTQLMREVYGWGTAELPRQPAGRQHRPRRRVHRGRCGDQGDAARGRGAARPPARP